MGRRYFKEGWKHSWSKQGTHPKRRIRIIPLLLMIIGAATVLVLAAKYLIVPLLVYLGGNV